MRQEKSSKEAAEVAIQRINKYYPGFSGAIIVANTKGEYGECCHNMHLSVMIDSHQVLQHHCLEKLHYHSVSTIPF